MPFGTCLQRCAPEIPKQAGRDGRGLEPPFGVLPPSVPAVACCLLALTAKAGSSRKVHIFGATVLIQIRDGIVGALFMVLPVFDTESKFCHW